MDVIEMLDKDHKRIRSLFSEIESAKDSQEIYDSFDKLDNILTIHARAEELVLYPQSRNCEDTVTLIDKGKKGYQPKAGQLYQERPGKEKPPCRV